MNDPTNGRRIDTHEVERLKQQLLDCQDSSKRMAEEIRHLKREVELMDAQIGMHKGIIERLEREAARQEPMLASARDFIIRFEAFESSSRATDRAG